ncbi:MAG TPA: ABC transporter substrate-binding protein [Actinomycetota bacterium]|jgi:osmoprotectant transport system substrate-binding protein
MKLARALVPSLLLLSACSPAATSAGANLLPRSGHAVAGPVIRVASFDFPESILLAQIYGRALAAAGYPVRLELNVGEREIVEPALQQGLVDLVPEYLGSALAFVGLGKEMAGADPATAGQELTALFAARGIEVMTPAPAQDQNVVAVTAATAQADDLRTVSDLAPFASRMTFGGPPECPQRPFCLPGLRRVYGLNFESFVPLDAGGPYTVQALERGDVQAALLFSTDGAIQTMGFTVLRDDRGLQRAENVTPVVRRAIVNAYGLRLEQTLDNVSAMLTTDALTALNVKLAAGGSAATVAADWLEEHGVGR